MIDDTAGDVPAPVRLWLKTTGELSLVDSAGAERAIPAGPASGGATIRSGSGVPSNGVGVNGDFYFRTDTPGSANQRLYVRSAGAYVGIL